LMPARSVPPVAIKSSTCSTTHNSGVQPWRVSNTHVLYDSAEALMLPVHRMCYSRHVGTHDSTNIQAVHLTSSTRCPALMAPVCISILSVEYSVSYDSHIVSPAEGTSRRVCRLSWAHPHAVACGIMLHSFAAPHWCCYHLHSRYSTA
jgi:hypothetical protein